MESHREKSRKKSHGYSPRDPCHQWHLTSIMGRAVGGLPSWARGRSSYHPKTFKFCCSPCPLQGDSGTQTKPPSNNSSNPPVVARACPASLLGTKKVCLADAHISLWSTASHGRAEGRRSTSGKSRWGSYSPCNTPNSHFHHLPSAAPPFWDVHWAGAARAGKGRLGAGRSLYIASRRGVGAAASQQDTERRKAASAASRPSLPRFQRFPAVSLRSEAFLRCAPGGALSPLSEPLEETSPGLGKCRAGVRVEVFPR